MAVEYKCTTACGIYSSPNFSTSCRIKDISGKVITIPNGTVVSCILENVLSTNRLKVQYSYSGLNITGYVNSNNFTKVSNTATPSGPSTAGTKYYISSSSGAIVYSSAAASKGTEVKTLPQNWTFVAGAGSTKDWLKCSSGWIRANACKVGDPPRNSVQTPSTPVTATSATSKASTKQSSVSNASYTYDPMPVADEQAAIAEAIYNDVDYEEEGPLYTNVYDIFSATQLNSNARNIANTDMSAVLGVFGLPYQFLASTDGRIGSEDASSRVRYNEQNANNTDSYSRMGFEYSDKIASKAPILFLAPGRPNFMGRYAKKGVRESVLSQLTANVSSPHGLDSLFGENGVMKYYTFQYMPIEYYNMVNPMCREAAIYMGIGDVVLPGNYMPLKLVDWKSYTKKNFSISNALNADYMHVPFYIDSDVTSDDSFGNSTGQSSLASSVNGISDMARELRFLTGYSNAALDAGILDNPDVQRSIDNVQDIVRAALGKNHFLDSLSKHFSTVANGGKLLFPQIWTDSDTGRSYNIKMKFASPDNDKLSIYLNVLVPLFHLLPLVGPQADPSNPNGFNSPFLVRGLYKSFFNIDTGIITGMSVTRGAEAQWTVDGVPSVIDVSISLKDLYDVLTFSADSGGFSNNYLCNTAQMDYISNLCGINMYKPEFARLVSSYLALVENNFLDIPRDIWSRFNIAIGGAAVESYNALSRRR